MMHRHVLTMAFVTFAVWLASRATTQADGQLLLTAKSRPDKATELPPPKHFGGMRAGDMRDDNGLKLKLLWCPPGKFKMDNDPRYAVPRAANKVLARGFWLGKYEVTQGEWQRVMETTPWEKDKTILRGPDYPATYLSWDDVIDFCEKFTKTERLAGRLPLEWEYVLPTEAQWEYACRAGTTTLFSYGDDIRQLGDYAWHLRNTHKVGESYAHVVGKKLANPWGLHDMHGNVEEWCKAVWLYNLHDDRNTLTVGGRLRVQRGGAWGRDEFNCRSAFRNSVRPSERNRFLGFRLACEPSIENGGESPEAKRLKQLCSGLVDKSESVRQANSEALEKVQPELHKLLIPIIIERSGEIQVDCIAQLVDFGIEARVAAPVLWWCIEHRKSHTIMLLQAFHALTHDDKRVAAYLITQMKSSRDKTMVLFAIRSLPELADANPSDAVGALIKVVSPKPNSATTRATTRSNRNQDESLVIPAINSLGAMGKHGKPARDILRKYKGHSSENVREAAAQALDKIDSAE